MAAQMNRENYYPGVSPYLLSKVGLVSLAASTQALITLGSPGLAAVLSILSSFNGHLQGARVRCQST